MTYALEACAWCGFLFDPSACSFAYPYCGPRCEELGMAKRDKALVDAKIDLT